MRKMVLIAAVLLLTPVLGSAQVTPDTTRPGRPLRARLHDMTPEMRQAYAQGFRHGRMTGARGARDFAPGVRGQRAGRGGAAGVGLLAPSLRAQLELTDEQVKQLAEIRERQREVHRPRMEALRNEREKRLEQRELFRQQTRALMLEVLTPEQRAKFEALEQQPAPGRRGRW